MLYPSGDDCWGICSNCRDRGSLGGFDWRLLSLGAHYAAGNSVRLDYTARLLTQDKREEEL